MTQIVRPGETLDGADGGPGPSRWPAARRRQLREFRRHQCIPDPARPGKRIHPSAACPHGTEGGYTNWGCECAVIPGTWIRPWIEHPGRDAIHPDQLFWPRPGCEPVGVAAANARKRRRRTEPVVTPVPSGTIDSTTPPPGPPAPPTGGRHRKTRSTG